MSCLAAILTLLMEVEGAVSCPTAAEVTAKLRPLLAGEAVGLPGERVRIERQDGNLRVALVGEDGRVQGQHNIDDRFTCEDKAEAAAVIVASWQGRRAAPVATLVAPPAPVARGGAARGPSLALGAAAGSAGGIDAFVPAFLFELGFHPRAGGLGLGLRGVLTARHNAPFANGQIGWRRWPLSLGPSYSVVTRPLTLVFDVAPAAAWLSVEGQGFTSNERHDTLDLGLVGGVRARHEAWGRPWLGITGSFWPRRTVLHQAPEGRRAALAPWELLLAVGVALGGS